MYACSRTNLGFARNTLGKIYFLPDRAGEKRLFAKFLLNSFFSKFAPLTNYLTDSDAEFNDETKSVM
jgi:hypothetical protein